MGIVAAFAPRRRRFRAFLAVALFAFALAPAEASAQEAVAEWKVIVHPHNPVRSLSRDELERIYRKKSRFWSDGSAIVPLNLSGEDPLRRQFSVEVLRDTEENLATFWNREYFQGIAPPAMLHSSKAVVAFVAATPGAIGYVYAADVDASVAVVEVAHAH